MYYDYHMHSNFSNDSIASMEDMINKSIELGVREICFTDHMDFDVDTDYGPIIDLNNYFNKLELLKNKYKDKIIIKKGLELGLQKQIVNQCSEVVKSNLFDFIICSIHSIDKKDLYFGHFFKDKTQH